MVKSNYQNVIKLTQSVGQLLSSSAELHITE